MRRLVLTAGVSISMLAFGPATALAKHHPRHHRSHKHHSTVRHETFGTTTGAPTTTNSADNAGTVDSFSNGVLTIKLNDGSTVSGQVTDATELECDSAAAPTQVGNDEQGPGGDNHGDNSGDNNGGGDNGAGDQNGGQDENGQDENAQSSCTTAALTNGTVVREARLRISSAGSVWEKVELVQP